MLNAAGIPSNCLKYRRIIEGRLGAWQNRSLTGNEVKMGVWGAGLYSGDFAMDLRSTIGAVARLPFDNDKLLDILGVVARAA